MSADSIVRLFVFSSSEELLRFNGIMKRNFDAYGSKPENGGVFLCSTESYLALLNRWGFADENPLSKDFGILKFRNDDSAIFATLDHKEFKFTVYDQDHDTYPIYELVCEHLERLKSVSLGEADQDSGVVRWSPKWESDTVELTSLVDRIFPNKHHSITHVVLLRAYEKSEEVTDQIRQLVGRLHKQRNVLKIQSVEMKQRCDLATHPPSDGRYAAALTTREDFDYCIVIEFENKDDLMHYYQHEVHSIEREKLYCSLNPAVKAPFETAARLLSKKTQERSRIFLDIEKAMTENGFVVRFDLVADDRMMFIKG